VTVASGDLADNGAARDFVRDWQAVRDNGDLQFAPVDMPKPPETPGWLKALGDAIGDFFGAIFDFLGEIGKAIGLSGTVLVWILGAIIVGLLVLLVWRILDPMARFGRKPETPEQEEWVPEQAAAIGLLEDADRLAAAGRFGEATHLLLQRSVFQIHQARPGLLDPSSTAREISVLPALPEGARNAFRVIAERVEISLFALRALSAEDWQAARKAYAGFALSPREAGA
jgi:hypothetical protein